MGFAIVYSFLLRVSTAPVVWVTMVLVFFLLLGIGSLLLFKAGLLNSAFLTKEFPGYPTVVVGYTSNQKTALEVNTSIFLLFCYLISAAFCLTQL